MEELLQNISIIYDIVIGKNFPHDRNVLKSSCRIIKKI